MDRNYDQIEDLVPRKHPKRIEKQNDNIYSSSFLVSREIPTKFENEFAVEKRDGSNNISSITVQYINVVIAIFQIP